MFRVLGKLIVGLLAIVGAIVLVIVSAAALIIPGMIPETSPVPDRVILTLDLDQPVEEGVGSEWLPGQAGGGTRLYALLDTLDRASRDERVQGLVATVRAPDMGLAQAQEVRDAIQAFRASGKPAFVHAETMPAGGGGTKALYVASAFDEIWMQPSGEVGLTGVSAEIPFLAEALGEWGLSFDALARQEYKAALSSLSESDIPPPQEANMRRLVTSWFDQIQAGLSAARGVGLEDLRPIIDRAPISVEAAIEAGLIDRAGYGAAFDDAVEAAMGDHPRLSVGAYGDRLEVARSEDARRIALVHGVGPVVPGGGDDALPFGTGASLRADDLAKAVRMAVEDERVAAIVLRLDSPGGDYVASDTARQAVAQARERGTPVIVSMGNVVASGGYFIALEADHVMASPGTVTGSIGVAAGKPVASALWADLGVSWARLAEGRNAAMWSINAPFTPSQREALNRRLDAIYADFTTRVGAARELSETALDRAARGRVFSGADALDVGLVDELGGLRAAFRLAREAAALPADEPVVIAPYPAPKDPLTRLLELLESQGLPGVAGGLSGLSGADLRALARLARSLEPALGLLNDTAPPADSSAELRYRGPTEPASGPLSGGS